MHAISRCSSLGETRDDVCLKLSSYRAHQVLCPVSDVSNGWQHGLMTSTCEDSYCMSAGVLLGMMATSTGSAEKGLAESMANTQKEP